jgi:hypothetical protein
VGNQYRAASPWTLDAASSKSVEVAPAEDFEGWARHFPATSSESYMALEMETWLD